MPFEQLKIKLDQYQVLLPYFFGWFINLDDSAELIETSKEILNETLKIFPEFKKDLDSKNRSDELIGFKTGILHCTTKFVGKDKKVKEIFAQNCVDACRLITVLI